LCQRILAALRAIAFRFAGDNRFAADLSAYAPGKS
jgi:hypothetical protein